MKDIESRRYVTRTYKTETLVSPSRSYVVFTEDPVSDQEDVYLVTLPYHYGNDEIEAVRYLYENRLPEPTVTNCLTFEMYVKEKYGIRVIKVSETNKKPSRFVSPSRRYIFVYKNTKSGPEHIYDLKNLSEVFMNNVDGAIAYCKDKFVFGAEAEIINCLPYEFHVASIQEQEKVSMDLDDPKPLLKKEKELPDNFISPTRRYIIVYRSLSSLQERMHDIHLPSLYVNDVSGATSYYLDNIASKTSVMISCVPYEWHIANIQEQEKTRKSDKWNFDRIKIAYGLKEEGYTCSSIAEIMNLEEKTVKEMLDPFNVKEKILVSPSRCYVVFVNNEDATHDTEYHYLIVLPGGWNNNEIGALEYLYASISPEAQVTNCLTYETYLKTPGWRPLPPYRAVTVMKKKN